MDELDTKGADAGDAVTASSLNLDPEALSSRPPPERIGSVTLVRELGMGASGRVWLGRDEALARDVAVKVFNDAARTDAQSEFDDGARRVSSVTHPNLGMIYAAGVHDGRAFLVMEFIPGWTLADVAHRLGPLDATIVAAIGVDLCAGLGALHAHDIAHRDVKPSNIMLRSDGRVVLTDFGLAVQRPPASMSAKDPMPSGTPAYMAPEMFDGVITTRTDVYAAGLTLAESLCGHRIVRGDIATMAAIHRAGLIDLWFAPDGLREVLARCLHVAPLYRFKSAGHLGQALEPLAGSAPNTLALLADRMRATEAPPGPAEKPATSRGSGVRNALGVITAHRSQARTDAPGPRHLQPASPVASPERSLVPRGYFCTHCAYDLGGVPANGPCPECEAPIAASMARAPLRLAGAAALRSLNRGLLVAELAVFGIGVIWFGSNAAASSPLWAAVRAAALAVCFAAATIAARNILRFPRLDARDPRIGARLVVGLWIAAGVIYTGSALWTAVELAEVQPQVPQMIRTVPAMVAVILMLLAWERMLRRLIELSRRTPPPARAHGRLRAARVITLALVPVLSLAALTAAAEMLPRDDAPIPPGAVALVLLIVGTPLVLGAFGTGFVGSSLLRRAISSDLTWLRETAER